MLTLNSFLSAFTAVRTRSCVCGSLRLRIGHAGASTRTWSLPRTRPHCPSRGWAPLRLLWTQSCLQARCLPPSIVRLRLPTIRKILVYLRYKQPVTSKSSLQCCSRIQIDIQCFILTFISCQVLRNLMCHIFLSHSVIQPFMQIFFFLFHTPILLNVIFLWYSWIKTWKFYRCFFSKENFLFSWAKCVHHIWCYM